MFRVAFPEEDASAAESSVRIDDGNFQAVHFLDTRSNGDVSHAAKDVRRNGVGESQWNISYEDDS